MKENPRFRTDRSKSSIVYSHSDAHLSLTHVVGFAEYCWDGDTMLRVISVPTRETQTEYMQGEGPQIMSRSHILRETSPGEAFAHLRAQILTERINPKFPQIKGFVSIPPRLVLIGEHMTAQKRTEICDQLVGAYPRNNIYFAASEKLDVRSVTEAKKAILSNLLPHGWEIVQSSDLTWLNSFSILGGGR